MVESSTPKRSPMLNQLFVVLGALLNVMSHGSCIGIPGVMLPQLRRPGSDIIITDDQASWIASTLGLGLIAGNFISPFVMKEYGRKIGHQLCTLPIIIGWFLLANSASFATIIVGRFLQGMSMGMQSPVGPTIIAEYTSPKSRGAFLGGISTFLAAGMLKVHVLGSYLHWKTTAMICSSSVITSLIIMIFSPETPNWLASQGRFDEAKETFFWLRGSDIKSVQELDKLIQSKIVLLKRKESNARFSVFRKFIRLIKLFTKRKIWQPSFVMFNMCIIFQFCCHNIIPSYTAEIVEGTMGSTKYVDLAMVLIDISRFISSIVGIYLVIKLTRRCLLFISGIATVIGFVVLSTCLYLQDMKVLEFPSPWYPMSILLVCVFVMTLGIVQFPWTLSGEVFPLAHKSLGGFVSGINLSIFLFTSLKTAPMTFSAIGLHGGLAGYSLILILCLVNLYYFLPETKDKTLQEIEEHYKRRRRRTITLASFNSGEISEVKVNLKSDFS